MVEVKNHTDSRQTYYPHKCPVLLPNPKLLALKASCAISVDSVIIRINLLITKRSSHSTKYIKGQILGYYQLIFLQASRTAILHPYKVNINCY